MLSTRLGTPDTTETTVPFRADQALSVERAVRAFTRNVTFVNGDENELGQLDVGYGGDVAVPSQDIFSIPANEIGDRKVELTVSAGRIVHGDEESPLDLRRHFDRAVSSALEHRASASAKCRSPRPASSAVGHDENFAMTQSLERSTYRNCP